MVGITVRQRNSVFIIRNRQAGYGALTLYPTCYTQRNLTNHVGGRKHE